MLDKIIDFINEYCPTKEAIKRTGKYKTVSAGLLLLLERQSFQKEELRKELSKYTKRIISETEFNRLLDYDRIEYEPLLYE